ncbi:MAG: isocitrate/isopropylmalate dehydrogenase family protein [Promethearchaeota archaeon]
MRKKIAITKGDGIGPEVINEGIKILNVIQNYTDHEFELIEAPAGGMIWKEYGENLPEKSFNTMKSSDAILFGAIGLPDLPPGVAESAILKIRQGLDLYVNLRPIKLYDGLRDRCPLKEEFIQNGIDIIIVRENTEGLYANIGGFLRDDIALNSMIYSRKGCARVIEYAYKLAKRLGHSKITSVDKANLLKPSQLWRKIFEEIGKKFPELEKESIYVDAFCQWLIRAPYKFQTVVTGNMFGDIISDEGAFLIGSLGMASSGNIHPGQVSMYEPIHGSAPDIAGKNIANPIGAILSVKLMMEESFEDLRLGKQIDDSVNDALMEGRTLDIKNENIKTLSTREMGDLIASKLKQRLKN